MLPSARIVRAGAAVVSPADRWTQFRGTPALLGTLRRDAPEQPASVLWTYDAGDAIESSAAIVDGVVYVGSQTGELHAVNLADGKLEWKYKASTDGIGESSPTVAGGLVYVGDLSGVLHAVQTATGAGGVDVQDEHARSSRRRSSSGDKVLIGSYDSNLYALGAKDGKLRVEGADRRLRSRARRRSSTASPTSPAATRSCAAIRISDGTKCFKMSFGAYTGASPAIVDGRAYFGTYENDVLAVDLKANKIVWSYKHPDRNFPFYSSPAVLADRVIVGGRDKMVHALDKKTGKPVWTFSTGARVDSSPVVAGGLAYIGSNDGKLYVLDVDVGQERVPVRSRRPALGLPRRSRRAVSSSVRRTASCFVWGRCGLKAQGSGKIFERVVEVFGLSPEP